jgi:hypothetical protein
MTLKRHRLRFIVLALVVLCLGAVPGASARPIDEVGYTPAPPSSYQSRPIEVVTDDSSDSGFSWGDAEIGAGAMLAMIAIGLGGTLVVISHRKTRPARTV